MLALGFINISLSLNMMNEIYLSRLALGWILSLVVILFCEVLTNNHLTDGNFCLIRQTFY